MKGISRRLGLIRAILSLTVIVTFPLTQSHEQKVDFPPHNQSRQKPSAVPQHKYRDVPVHPIPQKKPVSVNADA